jgi:hypothetical protein
MARPQHAPHRANPETAITVSAGMPAVGVRLQVLKGLRRGVLSGDTPALMMWRLCTNSLQQSMQVRPSLGGMLASILMHKIQRMRQQVWSSKQRVIYTPCPSCNGTWLSALKPMTR